MANYAEDLEDAGAGIVWVLERTASNAQGTAERCIDFMTDPNIGADRGWCVGDGQTQPTSGEFDDSPFSVGRGFDLVVRRRTMVIEATSAHGSPGGNENLDGAEILELVEDVLAQ